MSPGVTETIIASIDKALAAHELIKIRYNERKKEKKQLTSEIAGRVGCEIAGIIGHVAILYRHHEDPEKRKVKLKEG